MDSNLFLNFLLNNADLIIPAVATTGSIAMMISHRWKHSSLSEATSIILEEGAPASTLLSENEGKYVAVTGVVALKAGSKSYLIESSSGAPEVNAVVVETSIIRHFSRWSEVWRDWVSDRQTMSTSTHASTFTVNPSSTVDTPSVTVQDHNIKSAASSSFNHISLPHETRQFTPAQSTGSVTGLVGDLLMGERNQGTEIVHRALPIGTRITTLGFLTRPKTMPGFALSHEPPSSSTGDAVARKPFVISTESYETLVASSKATAKVWFWVALCGFTIGCGFVGRRLWLLWKSWRAKVRKEQEEHRKLQERRRRLEAEGLKKSEKVPGASEVGPEMCVICMGRPRDTLVMDCAHFMMCQVCAESVNECPVCRTRIKKRVLVFA